MPGMFISHPARHPLLAGLVDRVWCAAPKPSAGVIVEWVLPTCRPQMIFSPHTSLFVGPKVVAQRIERRMDQPTVGVSLAAGAAASFIGYGGDEMCGETVPLEAVLPVGSLPEQLAGQSALDALRCIENELVNWLRLAHTNPAVLVAERAIRSGHPAGNISAILGADRRKFVPEFRRMVGVAPKRYERISRFNRAIEAIRRSDAEPLAAIAVSHGFADQAHLTGEVSYFAQTTPSRIHRDGSSMINHVEPDKISKT